MHFEESKTMGDESYKGSIAGTLQFLTVPEHFDELLCVLGKDPKVLLSVCHAMDSSELAFFRLKGDQLPRLYEAVDRALREIYENRSSNSPAPEIPAVQRLCALIGPGVGVGWKQMGDTCLKVFLGPPQLVEEYARTGKVVRTEKAAPTTVDIMRPLAIPRIFHEMLCILGSNPAVQASTREAIDSSTLAIVRMEDKQLFSMRAAVYRALQQICANRKSVQPAPEVNPLERFGAFVGPGVIAGLKRDGGSLEVILGSHQRVVNYMRTGKVAPTVEEAMQMLTIPQNFHEALCLLGGLPDIQAAIGEAMAGSTVARVELTGDQLISLCDAVQQVYTQRLANRMSSSPAPEIPPLERFGEWAGLGVSANWKRIGNSDSVEVILGPLQEVEHYLTTGSLSPVQDGDVPAVPSGRKTPPDTNRKDLHIV